MKTIFQSSVYSNNGFKLEILQQNCALYTITIIFRGEYKYSQPCQNVPAANTFATSSQFLAAYSTLDFTRSPPADRGTWHLLHTTPSMLPTSTTTKHFDRTDSAL